MSGRQGDWWKRVPATLLEKQELWRGPKPVSSTDPVWRAYQKRREAQRIRVMNALADEWRVKGAETDLAFWRDMTINLLELFPAFEVLPETRGNKRNAIDPDAVARRARRDRQRTGKISPNNS
jgi:hypothetical protein